MRFTPADEGRHDEARGVESWGVEFGGPRATGRVRFTLDVEHGRAGFVADFLLAGIGRVVVADESIPLPRPAAGLEVRADALWASWCCETPFEHWTLGLEAFGLRLDDAGHGSGRDADSELEGSWETLVGERLAVGYDLEWELTGPPEPLADGAGYSQPGTCFGEVLVVRERITVDAPALRDHWWGGAPDVRVEQSTLGRS